MMIAIVALELVTFGLFRRGSPALKHQGMPKHAQLARAGARTRILTADVWVENVNTLLGGSL